MCNAHFALAVRFVGIVEAVFTDHHFRQRKGGHLHIVNDGQAMEPGGSAHITPGTVHRFRAVTDCLLFEVSTPELHDVVRPQDRDEEA